MKTNEWVKNPSGLSTLKVNLNLNPKLKQVQYYVPIYQIIRTYDLNLIKLPKTFTCIGAMEAEDDWSPPWDCDSDNETNYYDYTNASMKVNVSSPFKNTLNEANNDSSTEDEQQMSSTKKKLHFDEIETEMEEIHKNDKNKHFQDLKTHTQDTPHKNKVGVLLIK